MRGQWWGSPFQEQAWNREGKTGGGNQRDFFQKEKKNAVAKDNGGNFEYKVLDKVMLSILNVFVMIWYCFTQQKSPLLRKLY